MVAAITMASSDLLQQLASKDTTHSCTNITILQNELKQSRYLLGRKKKG
jgi:hypothetical protein